MTRKSLQLPLLTPFAIFHILSLISLSSNTQKSLDNITKNRNSYQQSKVALISILLHLYSSRLKDRVARRQHHQKTISCKPHPFVFLSITQKHYAPQDHKPPKDSQIQKPDNASYRMYHNQREGMDGSDSDGTHEVKI